MTAENNRDSGFSLVELMVVMAIIGILASIAYPSYLDYLARARRADAKAVLMETAQFMERYYTQNGTYVGAALPYAEAPKDGTTKYYDIAAAGVTATAFTLEAVPKGSMAADSCGTLTINQAGQKGNSGGTKGAAQCWNS